MSDTENNGPYRELGSAGRPESATNPVFWSIRETLAGHRLIVVATLTVAIAAIVISLLIPNQFQATARVLPPEGGSSSPMAAMLSRGLPPGAAQLLGGGRTEYNRYLALLSSRTMLEAVVDRFDLVEVYGLSDASHARQRALNELSEHVSYNVDREFRYLAVSVLDTDPQRAADMANFLVDELNRRNAELSAQNASLFRRFVERRYNETLASIDSLKNATQEFQQRHGVYDVEAQARGLLEQTAGLRARAIELEIQHETMLAQFGPDHPTVRSIADAVRAANRRYQSAIAGGERVLPVAQDAVPAVMREYVDLEQERLTQARLLEVVAPLYEQARFDEEREMQALQVIDFAVPPVRKVAPKRSIMVIMATMSAFFLSILYVLAAAIWRERAAGVASHLRANGIILPRERTPVA
jgi:tyrosine-protein kinase Etk/Wzc